VTKQWTGNMNTKPKIPRTWYGLRSSDTRRTTVS
jgi:hypothetical protein